MKNANKNEQLSRNATSRLKRTLCVAAAAATTFAHHQVTAFTQPDNTSRHQSKMEVHDLKMNVATPLSDHISQNDALPVMKEAAIIANAFNANMSATAIDEANENIDGLSEFAFSSLYPNGSGNGHFKGSGVDALSMSTVSDEQREFDMMIGRALDT